jgi:hypothetical protein
MDLSAGIGALIALGMLLTIPNADDGAINAAQAQAAVQGCGYATSPVTRVGTNQQAMLPWVIPPEPGAEPLMFFARDPEDVGRVDGRLFTVLVFPDEERATRVYTTAIDSSSEAAQMIPGLPLFRSNAMTPDRGPILVRGAGQSLWRGRLAAFQLAVPPEPPVIDIAVELRKRGAEMATATPEQVREAIEDARGGLKARSRDDLASSPYGVDRDFADCLSIL